MMIGKAIAIKVTIPSLAGPPNPGFPKIILLYTEGGALNSQPKPGR